MVCQRFIMKNYKIEANSNEIVIFICEFKQENDKEAVEFLDRIHRFLVGIHGEEITTNLYEERWIEGI